MKKMILLSFILVLFSARASAGFLTGSSSPYVDHTGQLAFRLNTSILMDRTPFSSLCLSAKYALTDPLAVYAKIGAGNIDYTTVTGFKMTSAPQIETLGAEWMLSGTRSGAHYSVVAEYEKVTWGSTRRAT